MEIKTEKKLNSNGTNTVIETTQTTPEDGLVHQRTIRPSNMDNYGKYHKGYSTTKTFIINDPRVTRPLAYTLCSIFIVIGIILLLFGNWFFGIIFVSVGIYTLINSKKDIDKIAEKLEKQGHDVTVDSEEEKEQLKNEVVEMFNSGVDEVVSKTFTKDNKKWFMKVGIPFYTIVSLIIFLVISIFINIFLGIFVLFILVITGVLYFYIFSKIFKH